MAETNPTKYPKFTCQECGARLMVIQEQRFDEYALISEVGAFEEGRESGKDRSDSARIECSVNLYHNRAASALSHEERQTLLETFYTL